MIIKIILALVAAASKDAPLAANLPSLDSSRIHKLRVLAIAGNSDSAAILCMSPVLEGNQKFFTRDERVFWMTKLWSEGHVLGLNLGLILGGDSMMKSFVLKRLACPNDSLIRQVFFRRLNAVGARKWGDSVCRGE